MSGFYIKKVIAKSAVKGDASVTFGKGLTIIQGRSDSGKTCVANCIDFIFGGSVDKPFKETAKYDGVSMIVASNDNEGEVTLHRTVGKNQVEVSSNIDGIASGTYDVNYRKGAKNPPLNEVWLKLIGIEQETMIVANARFEKKRLTWRNLLRVFYLDENRVDDIDSIVEPKHRYMENTLFLSALLFLITGRTFTETDAQEKKEIKKARRVAVKEYVNRKIQDAAERKEQLEKDLHIFEGADVEEQIAKATAALQETQRKIDRALAESQRILSSILEAEERAAECDVLLTRYHRLAVQYKADIQRLSLIVEGEEAYQKVPQSTKCPYCEGTIAPRKRVSYIASSKVEMERTIAQLSGLEDTEKDVEDRKKEIRAELEELKRQRDALESKIKTELRPQENEQQNTVNAYKSYLRISSEIALIETYATDFGNDLTALETEQKDDKSIEYHPKDYFGDDFATTMSEYADSILKECCYSGLLRAHFNFSTFDIEVNGEDKGTSHGKGYRSYLNTVMIMMLRKYLSVNAKFDPHIFIIDTPLHGFDDGMDETMPDSMRAGLYRYFMNHQDEGQLIIIENLDHIPHLDYEKHGAVVETFEKIESPGKRYGFLNDVK
ncbi:AAA family ATPase [Faecousia sp.]|uniref:AAA family ATPase n=1 Tax=Faecousia sp. TaxID=2952921 RepID=UPI003AB316E6